MALSLSRFAELRPYLYHLTSKANLPRIRALRRLESAKSLLLKAGLPTLIDERRSIHRIITVDGTTVSLRDQAPLFAGNIEYEEGWGFEDVIVSLNSRVFFWPGRETGPIDYGIRHFKRYKDERPSVIRVPTDSLLRENPGSPPLFCRFNSGSPRCSDGRKSPRGSQTFLNADCCDFLPSKVVEVTFSDGVVLPMGTELRSESWSRWQGLFAPLPLVADA